MSEMISEMGAGFVGVGDTLGERQNRLNAACTAWNMACGSPEVQQRQLEQHAEGYLRFNPATSADDLAKIRKDMETLIGRKLQLFPDDRRQIDFRTTNRDGKPAVEFSWEGGDGADGTPLTGRGWAILQGDELNGMIVIHLGEDSEFVAKPVTEKKSTKRK